MATASTTAASGTRFAFVHSLRGIAALLVVWSHLSGFWLLSNASTSSLQNLWQQWIVVPFHVFQNGGHLGVVLFFLISGYIITHTSLREDRASFAIKRVMRIFPPLIFATALTWALVQVSQLTSTSLIGVNNGGGWHWLSATVLLDGFLPGGLRALDVTWTLVIELYFYILAFILLRLTKTHPLKSVWCMTGLWAGLFVTSSSLNFLGANGQLSIYVGFLILGQIIYFAQQKLIQVADALIIGALVSLFYLLFTEAVNPGFLLAPGGWSGVEPLVSYAFAIIVFLAMMRLAPSRVVQPFRMLGDVSYSLYLLHIPVGITVLNLLDILGVPTSLNTIIAICASIAAAWVAHKLVEVPFQKLARRILKERESRTLRSKVVHHGAPTS